MHPQRLHNLLTSFDSGRADRDASFAVNASNSRKTPRKPSGGIASSTFARPVISRLRRVILAQSSSANAAFVQDFAADRDWQKAVDRVTDDGRRLVRKSQPAMAH
jgi:hypothetical protein